MLNRSWLGPYTRATVAACLLLGTLSNGLAFADPTPTAPSTGPRHVLPGHTVAALAQAAPIAPTDPRRELQLTISLNPRNQQQLDLLLQQQNDPRSAEFRKYLTPDQFAAQFGQTQASVDAASAFLTAQGLSVTNVAPNRLLMNAFGSVDVIQRAFGVQLRDFAFEGRTVHAPLGEPSVPATLAGVVHGIHGLDDALRLEPQFQRPSVVSPGGGPAGGYTPRELKTAYDATALPNGAGQNVALVEFDNYNRADILTFASFYGLGTLDLRNHPIDGGNPGGPGAIEVELDIEVLADIAPGAIQHIYMAPNSLATSLDVYSAIVNDNIAQVISSSWGQCEQLIPRSVSQAHHTILSQAAAQGQAVFVAAGDSGAYSCDNNPLTGDPLAVTWPASDPWAISVGGTHLVLGPGGSYVSESVWGCPAPCPGQRDPHGSGGGGGLSTVYSRPEYQVGPGVINQFSNGMRQTPDVSADADPATGYSVFCTSFLSGCPGSGWIVVGGTSASAPLWAGIAAASNHYLAGLGKPGFGNGHNVLYQLFNTPQSFAAYHDVTTGNNLFYPATAGYDLASGIGSPDAFNFARDLANRQSLSLVTPLAAPVRLADTRTAGGAIQSGGSRCFNIGGIGGIPADAGAVVLNVTAVGQTTNGWVTIYPNGQPVPPTSTLNFGRSEYAMANGTIMPLGSGGQVCANVGTVDSVPGSSQVILDATGFLPGSALTQLAMLPAPARLVDTRPSGGPIGTGNIRCFPLGGQSGIPADAAAVVLNVTAVGYGTKGWLTAFPNGQPVPATSTVNFDPSEYAMANNAIVRLGPGGQACVNVGTVDSAPGVSQVILDATGYVTAGGVPQLPMLTSPQRVTDTRTSSGPISTGSSRCFSIGGGPGIPVNAAGVIVNVTAVGYGTRGWLTAYPAGQAVPATSTLNFDTSEYAVANGAIVGLGLAASLCVNVGTVDSAPGSSQVILDVVGYLLN